MNDIEDISLNIKEKSVKFFDIKNYEKINEFNLNFYCNKVENILSIFKEDKYKKKEHPLLLNNNYCFFCHELYNKNLFYLKYSHNKFDLGNFFNDNQIKLRKVYKKQKIFKRRFIHSSEHNNQNISYKNNKQSESDTDEFFFDNININIFEKKKELPKKELTILKNKFLSHKKFQTITLPNNIFSPLSEQPFFIPKETQFNRKMNSNNLDSKQRLSNENNQNGDTNTNIENNAPKITKRNYSVLNKLSIKTIFSKKISNIIYTNSPNSNILNTNNQLICTICCDNFKEKYNLQCGHYYCKECLIKFIISCLENISKFNEIKCLNEFCQQKIDDNLIEDLLDDDNFKKYKKFKKRIYSLTNHKLIPCPYPDCDGYGEKLKIKKNKLKCEECNNIFCILCLKIIDYNISEEEEIISFNNIIHNCSDLQTIDDDLTEKYFENNKNIKKCPKCNCWVEKIQNNCNNMKCSNLWCNYEFCWICMQKYDHKHYKNPFSQCFGLSQTDVTSKLYNYKGARIFKCIIISLVFMFVLFPMFVNFFSFSLITLYLKFVDSNRKKISFKNKVLKYSFMGIEYTFYFLIALAMISLGYLVLMSLIIGIPIYILIEKCHTQDEYYI